MLRCSIKLGLVFAAIFLVTACSGGKKKSTQQEGETNFALQFIRDAEGQYPTKIGMFDNEELRSRLGELMQQEADSLALFWNVETPIQLIDNVVYTSGCQQHNCPEHAYYLTIDLEKNSINVHVFKLDKLVVYAETDILKLPRTFEKDLKIVQKNAGIQENQIRTVSLSN